MNMLLTALQDKGAHLETCNGWPVMGDLVPEKEITCLD